jgi:hypothetical protein
MFSSIRIKIKSTLLRLWLAGWTSIYFSICEMQRYLVAGISGRFEREYKDGALSDLLPELP